MTLKLSFLGLGAVLSALAAFGQTQTEPKYPVDPETGRAIGAKEISPGDLRSKIAEGQKTLIIDVRSREAFEKETIPGAVYIPYEELPEALKTIPKDTLLVFT